MGRCGGGLSELAYISACVCFLVVLHVNMHLLMCTLGCYFASCMLNRLLMFFFYHSAGQAAYREILHAYRGRFLNPSNSVSVG